MATYRGWDIDGKGYVSTEDIKKILDNMNIHVSDEEAKVIPYYINIIQLLLISQM